MDHIIEKNKRERKGRVYFTKETEAAIVKYNNSKDIDKNYFKCKEKRVLIIAQTAGDSSLEYGLGNTFSTDEMISSAVKENPDYKTEVKVLYDDEAIYVFAMLFDPNPSKIASEFTSRDNDGQADVFSS